MRFTGLGDHRVLELPSSFILDSMKPCSQCKGRMLPFAIWRTAGICIFCGEKGFQ